MSESITHIIVHPREEKSAVAAYWQTYAARFPGLELEVAELDCGDYVLGGGVRVERKSATDFNLAVMDRRLYGEVARLKAVADQVVYVVEGDLFAERFHSDPQLTREALAWMTALQGVALLPSSGEAFSAEMLFSMAKLAQHGFGQPPVLRNGKPFDPRGAQLYVAEGLPGISPVVARRLLEHFGTLAALCAAPVEALAQVEGVPVQLAQRIRKVLDAEFRSA